MTGTLGVSAKIASGRSTSPLRSPSASKRGAWTGIGRLHLPRVRLARRTLGLDLLRRLPDEHEGALGAGDAAFDHEQVPVGVYADDLVRAGGRALVAHLAGHAHALEHPRGVGGADGARLAHVHGPVRLRTAAELVALDQTLEALAFAGARHVDQLAGLEHLGGQILTLLEAVVVADLDHVPVRVDVRALEHSLQRRREPVFLDRPEGDAGRAVAVLLVGAQAEDLARARLEHRHRRH